MRDGSSTNGGALPLGRLVDAAGFAGALCYAALAHLARQPGEPGLVLFFAIMLALAAVVFALYIYGGRTGEPFPLARLLLWAAVFRVCGLYGGPLFEDDFHRYLWDGYRFATVGTPYGIAPEAFFADASVPAAMQRTLDQINNPHLPTIYAPTTQLIFLLAYALAPGSVLALQSLLVLFDLALIGLLARLAPARNVLLYAWCPLVVKEIAFTAHPDGAGVCLLIAGILLARQTRWGPAALCLGLATGAKIFALAVVPFVLLGARGRHWLVFAATLGALYAPFVLAGATELDSLIVFAREWEFNSALFGLIAPALGATETKLMLGAVCGVFWLWCYVRHRRSPTAMPRGDWIYGALLAAAPVINAWYLLWLLPFAVVYPSVWAWTASAAVLLSYVTGLNLSDYDMQPYGQPAWVRPVEFGAVLLALAADGVRRQLRRREG